MGSRPWDYWWIQVRSVQGREWLNHRNEFGTLAFVVADNEREARQRVPERFPELKGREVRLFKDS